MDSSRFNRPRYWILAISILALTAAPAALYMALRQPAVPAIAFSEFLQQVQANAVAKVTFDERTIDITMKDGAQAQTIAPAEFLSANSTFLHDLVRRNVQIEVTPAPDPGALSWSAMATAAAFFALLAFTVYRTTAGRIPSMSGRARVADRGEHVVTVQDVAGVDEAKDEVKEIVDFLR